MPLTLNLLELGNKILRLKGELPSSDLDLDRADELIHLSHPLRYDFEVEKTDGGLFMRGQLQIPLDCECARCLKPFQYFVQLSDWALLLPWQGEEHVTVINDCVDLTPYLREDIVLAFPQHPLCKADCEGIVGLRKGSESPPSQGDRSSHGSDPWAELDKLEF